MRQQRGFTLLELVLVMVLIGILSALLSPFIAEAIESSAQHYAMSDVLSQGRFAEMRVVHDLRNIRSNTATDLSNMGANSITFNDVTGTQISYSLAGSNLQRNGVDLAKNVSALTFSYYDKTGAVTATVSQVCYINVSFIISQTEASQSFSQTVWIRNALC
jgi:prepilin-type N-terminal cleavage/methylation domain-containing protein